MNRTDLQRIAVQHLDAATSLLRSSHWVPAYYLAGYSVECGLKIAALDQQLLAAEDSSDDFRVNWAMVKDGSEDSRYEERSEPEARGIDRCKTKWECWNG